MNGVGGIGNVIGTITMRSTTTTDIIRKAEHIITGKHIIGANGKKVRKGKDVKGPAGTRIVHPAATRTVRPAASRAVRPERAARLADMGNRAGRVTAAREHSAITITGGRRETFRREEPTV